MANLQTWHEHELTCKDDISDLLDKLVWLRLRYQDGKLIPERLQFHWNDAFFEELKVLRKAGGRGYIVLFDEYGSYYKYVLDDNEVRGYAGKVVFEGDEYKEKCDEQTNE